MKYILIILGCISLGLGIAGIFLPLLPTTPFLLLTAFLFARSSDRLYNWLIKHPCFGNYISDFHIHKSIPMHAKIISLLLMWTSMCYATFFVAQQLWLQILLMAIAIGVTVHILSFKTKK